VNVTPGTHSASAAPADPAAQSLTDSVVAYYAAKLARHGPVARGVDWTCQATQELRFVQLVRLVDFARPFSLDDIGCGYGALVSYLERFHPAADIDYLGIDLSAAMVDAARRVHPPRARRGFVVGDGSPRVSDYAVASGVMNVKLDHADATWEQFIGGILRGMRRRTRCGFAVNFIAPIPQDAHPQLYRTEPGPWVAFCADELGCAVEVLSGYGLREFTLLARHGGG